MNIHTPERGANETREAYIQRRKDSHRAAKALKSMPVTGWPTKKPHYGKAMKKRIKKLGWEHRLAQAPDIAAA